MRTGEPVRVVVADDHDLFRRGLRGLLTERGIEVVGEAQLGADAVRLAQELAPDVVLMDLNMPGMTGVEAIQRLASAAPLTRILVLSVMADEAHVLDALLAGASGYLLKDAPVETIVEGVHAVARGESLLSSKVASRLVDHVRKPAEHASRGSGPELTPREHDVLELLARGLDNIEIGRALYLSPHTVRHHVSSILVKLQVENRLQAAVRAVRRGLV